MEATDVLTFLKVCPANLIKYLGFLLIVINFLEAKGHFIKERWTEESKRYVTFSTLDNLQESVGIMTASDECIMSVEGVRKRAPECMNV